MPRVKIVNGSERVFSVEEAARRLRGLGLRVGCTQEALGIPFEIEFPFCVGAASPDRSMVLEVRGGYNDLLALQRAVN
jgi:hypothetical protein